MKKQIILLMTDTTRKDMVGCYGNKKMFTPNLDALAQEGIRYENAYTCQPVCGPARSAIFTGTFPHSNGMVTNGVPLGANVKTIGQRLTDNGIKCGYIGKWHLDGGDYFGLGCCPEGWDADYWYDMKCYLNELSENERVCSRQPNESFQKNLHMLIDVRIAQSDFWINTKKKTFSLRYHMTNLMDRRYVLHLIIPCTEVLNLSLLLNLQMT